MLVVAALGDDDSYACQVSPAESPHIVTVGAITPAGLPRKDSNYGGAKEKKEMRDIGRH